MAKSGAPPSLLAWPFVFDQGHGACRRVVAVDHAQGHRLDAGLVAPAQFVDPGAAETVTRQVGAEVIFGNHHLQRRRVAQALEPALGLQQWRPRSRRQWPATEPGKQRVGDLVKQRESSARFVLLAAIEDDEFTGAHADHGAAKGLLPHLDTADAQRLGDQPGIVRRWSPRWIDGAQDGFGFGEPLARPQTHIGDTLVDHRRRGYGAK